MQRVVNSCKLNRCTVSVTCVTVNNLICQTMTQYYYVQSADRPHGISNKTYKKNTYTNLFFLDHKFFFLEEEKREI